MDWEGTVHMVQPVVEAVVEAVLESAGESAGEACHQLVFSSFLAMRIPWH